MLLYLIEFLFIKISPEVGLSINERRLSKVDLPDPEGPTSEYIKPFLNL